MRDEQLLALLLPILEEARGLMAVEPGRLELRIDAAIALVQARLGLTT